MPTEVLAEWALDMSLEDQSHSGPESSEKRRMRIDQYLDQGHGSCWLSDDRVALIVKNALLQFDGERYRQLAWVIMPNHVHTMIEVFDGFPLDRVVHSWKSFTAKQANKILGRRGRFWSADYFDRFIRDDKHLSAVATYIEDNPVKAGLIHVARDWPWSSTSRKSQFNAGETPALHDYDDRSHANEAPPLH